MRYSMLFSRVTLDPLSAPHCPHRIHLGSVVQLRKSYTSRTSWRSSRASITTFVNKTRPLFSHTYKLLLPQPPCFHIHPNCRVPRGSTIPSAIPNSLSKMHKNAPLT